MSTMLENAFDADREEGTPPIELLPPGKYWAEISSATVGPTKNARGQAVNLKWTVTEGYYEKRVLFQSILIQHDSVDAQRFGRQKFKDVCAACGVTGSVTDLEVLLFKACTIYVGIEKDKAGQFPDKNKISRVSPVVAWNGSRTKATHDPGPIPPSIPDVLREASATPKAFEAKRNPMSDEIPF
jgi:hypothetical protein